MSDNEMVMKLIITGAITLLSIFAICQYDAQSRRDCAIALKEKPAIEIQAGANEADQTNRRNESRPAMEADDEG